MVFIKRLPSEGVEDKASPIPGKKKLLFLVAQQMYAMLNAGGWGGGLVVPPVACYVCCSTKMYAMLKGEGKGGGGRKVPRVRVIVYYCSTEHVHAMLK